MATKEEILEAIKWKFKASMQMWNSLETEEFASRPELLLGLVYTFLMGWGDALLANGFMAELSEFHEATKHLADDGWLPDDSWKWWLDANGDLESKELN